MSLSRQLRVAQSRVVALLDDVYQARLYCDLEFHVRISVLEGRHRWSDEQVEGRARHRKAQGPGRPARPTGSFLRGSPQLRQGGSRREQVVAACICQAQATRRAAEQRCSKPLLETSDRLAYGRRRNAKTPRRFGEAASFRRNDEHGYALDWVSRSHLMYHEALLQASCAIMALIASSQSSYVCRVTPIENRPAASLEPLGSEAGAALARRTILSGIDAAAPCRAQHGNALVHLHASVAHIQHASSHNAISRERAS